MKILREGIRPVFLGGLGWIITMLIGVSSVYAVTLAEMQTMALNNREVIRQYETILEQSEEDIVLARGGFYPSVDIEYAGNALDEERLTESKENALIVGSISWNIFAGFQDKYNLLSAEKLKEVEEYRLQAIQQDVQLNVALAYLSVSERRANRRVAESQFQTLEKAYKDGESRFQVGLISKNDLLRFRVDYDNADITLKAADAGLQTSVNNLSRQVGSVIKLEDLDFAEFKQVPPLINRDEYMDRMLVDRSEIRAFESLIAATEARSEAELSGYYPRVDLVGSSSRYDDDFIYGQGTNNEHELRGQLNMSMNLFQGFTTEASVARAKLETRSTQYELAELKNELTTELDNLYIDLKVSLENVVVAKRAIEQAEENLRITELKYNEGLERETDYLDAIFNLARSQYNQVAVLRTAFQNNFRLIRMVDGF